MKILSFLLAVLLSGYATGRQDAPVGDEWQSPQQLSLNKQAPHAWFFSFPDVESARKVLPECSAYWRSLDGDCSQWRKKPSIGSKIGLKCSQWKEKLSIGSSKTPNDCPAPINGLPRSRNVWTADSYQAWQEHSPKGSVSASQTQVAAR
jgi:hypothetical protein